MRVKVYFNLHKKTYSIQHKGKVIQHANTVMLEDVEFKVSEAGRQRVLQERKKNVHAFVCGRLVYANDNTRLDINGFKVSYNPYKNKTFVRNGKPIHNCDTIIMQVTNNKRTKLKGK